MSDNIEMVTQQVGKLSSAAEDIYNMERSFTSEGDKCSWLNNLNTFWETSQKSHVSFISDP